MKIGLRVTMGAVAFDSRGLMLSKASSLVVVAGGAHLEPWPRTAACGPDYHWENTNLRPLKSKVMLGDEMAGKTSLFFPYLFLFSFYILLVFFKVSCDGDLCLIALFYRCFWFSNVQFNWFFGHSLMRAPMGLAHVFGLSDVVRAILRPEIFFIFFVQM